jgi:hypothetical protein
VADYCGSFKLLALSHGNISHDICQYFVRQIKEWRDARLWRWNRNRTWSPVERHRECCGEGRKGWRWEGTIKTYFHPGAGFGINILLIYQVNEQSALG